MLSATSIYSVVCFMSIQIIFCYSEYMRKDFYAVSYNTTNPARSWLSGTGRVKRSIYDEMPELLKIFFQIEYGHIIGTTLTKQQPILANKYLPVIGNRVNPFRNVMDDAGKFVMYQDVENCIAVVYFEKFGKFYGSIGLNYYIADLPYNFDNNGNYLSGIIRKPYVNRNNFEFLHINPNQYYPPPSDIDAWEDFLRPFKYPRVEVPQLDFWELRQSTSRLLNEQQFKTYRGSKRHFPKKKPIVFGPWAYRLYYLETLVLVTRDLADVFESNFGENEYVAAIVRYHVIYFNAVNMLLKKLSKLQNEYFGMTINIAKIVIEGGSTLFGFEDDDGLQFTDVTAKLPQFFSNHSNSYEQDSFDYVFVHTSKPIMDENIMVDGISKHGQDMVEGRKTGKFYETIPITIVKFRSFYAHYAVAAHEIVRTLGVKITPKENGLLSMGQCYGIMQRGGPKCNICLMWDDDDHYEFLMFFSKNRNRCFLLNEPRSIHPPVVIRGDTPNQQCRCLGYDSYIKSHVNKVQTHVRLHGCSSPLQCHNVREHKIFYEETLLPFDGTPCGNNKVCWNKNCKTIGSSPNQTIQKQESV